MTAPILQRIAGGDKDALRECIKQYGGLVWYMARRFSRTSSDAEDATQDIFLQIWCEANRFNESLGPEKTFIAVIARRRLIDRLRRTSNEPLMESSVELLEIVASSESGNTSEKSYEVDQAVRALAELRPQYRQVLNLGLLQGLTHAEIAIRLGMPLGTVKTFMRRGLMRVREYMDIESTPPAVRQPHGSRSVSFDEFSVGPDRPGPPTAAGQPPGVAVEVESIAHGEFLSGHPLGLGVDESPVSQTPSFTAACRT